MAEVNLSGVSATDAFWSAKVGGSILESATSYQFFNGANYIRIVGNSFVFTSGALTSGNIFHIDAYADINFTSLIGSVSFYPSVAPVTALDGGATGALAGDDSLRSAANGSGIMKAYGGNDLLDATGGAFQMYGGIGNDTYVIDALSDIVVEDADAGTDEVKSSTLSLVAGSFANIERFAVEGLAYLTVNASGRSDGVTLISRGHGATLIGGTGNDIFDARDAIIASGNSITTMRGGTGNDSYYFDGFCNIIESSAASGGIDTILSYEVAANIDLRLSKLAGIENVTVVSGGAAVMGNSKSNTIIGDAGANVLDGWTGADVLRGRGGNDTYIVDNAGDVVDEAFAGSAGFDEVDSSISFSLSDAVHCRGAIEALNLTGSAVRGTGNSFNNLISGTLGNNILMGMAGSDTLFGGKGNDVLNGGTGVDTMYGNEGNDTFVVDNTRDRVVEGRGFLPSIDTVIASADFALPSWIEGLRLTGNAKSATGNALDNTIVGNANDNIIAGGAGRDVLTGGGGADVFKFSRAAGASDVIKDFTHNSIAALSDRIDLSAIDANGLAAGDATFKFLSTAGAAFTGGSGQLRWYQAAGAAFVEGDVNGDRAADFKIELTGLKVLVASDFVL